jgi:hypothetical protein
MGFGNGKSGIDLANGFNDIQDIVEVNNRWARGSRHGE